MDRDFLSLPIEEYLDRLASKQPTPGGGSVAALVATLGCALARMVGEYSQPSVAPTSTAETGWTSALTRLRRVEELLRPLVTKDAQVYAALRAATKHRKEHGEADGLFAEAVLEAVAVPLEIAALAAEALSILEAHRAEVGKYMLSDLGAAAWTLESAARSAMLMVQVNLPSLADARTREKIQADVEAIINRCSLSRTACCTICSTTNWCLPK